MLNGSPSTSIGKLPLNPTSANYTNAFWNVWTEDFLRRRYLSTASSDRSDEMTVGTKSTETKNRTVTQVKVEPKSNKGSYAIGPIPKDARTRSFDGIELDGKQIVNNRSFIAADSNGYISNDQNYLDSVWCQSLSLAHDTYSHNAQLEIASDHRLRVKIVKNLVAEEEIQLWFSEEILAILGIPFLTPTNILGKIFDYLITKRSIFKLHWLINSLFISFFRQKLLQVC